MHAQFNKHILYTLHTCMYLYVSSHNTGRMLLACVISPVFGYLMSNLKLTLAYFVYGPSLPPFDLANLRPDIIKDVDKWKQG